MNLRSLMKELLRTNKVFHQLQTWVDSRWQMAELFGVSTDYLLKDSMDLQNTTNLAEFIGQQENMPARRKVSLEEANAFLRLRKNAASRIALGVLLCIVSSAPLIFLVISYN